MSMLATQFTRVSKLCSNLHVWNFCGFTLHAFKVTEDTKPVPGCEFKCKLLFVNMCAKRLDDNQSRVCPAFHLFAGIASVASLMRISAKENGWKCIEMRNLSETKFEGLHFSKRQRAMKV